MRKKLLVVLIILTIIFAFIVLFIGSKSQNTNNYITVWLNHYFNKEGYKIIYPQNYVIQKNPNYPKFIKELDSSTLKLLINNLRKKDLVDFEKMLKEQVYPELQASNYTSDFNLKEGLFAYYIKEKGYFFVYNKAHNNKYSVSALILDASILNLNKDQEREFQSFISNHKNILGEPQIKLVDHLYDDIEHDFYFDKGVGFVSNYLVLLSLNSDIDLNLVKEIDINFYRNISGCKYCEFKH